MRDYEIRIDIDNLLHYSAVLKPNINNETLLMIIKSFSSYLRDLYVVMIYDAIYSNRYKGEWEPREEKGYLEYLGTIPSDHIFDLIKDALEIREIKNDIVIRIDPKYNYPGSNKYLIEVLKAIDNGTSKFNARPVLKGIHRNIRNNLASLWRGYLKKKGVA